jgi:peptidoglycan/LPS O-acetylase OafA/YrhL
VQSWGLFNTLTWNSPSWSISAEWLCYLLFPLSLLFINTTSGKQCLIYLFSILMLQGIILINQKSFNLDTTYEYGCLRAYFEFLQGMLLYKLYAAGYNKRYVTSDQAVIYAFIAGFALLLMNTMAESLIVLPMALLIYAVAQNTSATKAFLEYRPIYILGEISLSVYLLQHPVWLVYRNLNNFLLNHTPEQWWWAMACVNLILYFLCLFTLSLGVYRYIEKPMRTFIRARYTKSN